MSTLPDKQQDRINWCVQRVATWSARAASIGVEATRVADLDDQTEQTKTRYMQLVAARAGAAAAQVAFDQSYKAMSETGSELVRTIRAYARGAGGPDVYAAAEIAPPKPPTPVPAPGTPTSPTARIEPTGALMLEWKCKNPSRADGTVYEIHRQVNGGAWEPVASTGRKKHIDTTIPAGTSSLKYQVRAVRSTVAGIAAQFNVSLGSGSTMGVSSVAPETFDRSPRMKAA